MVWAGVCGGRVANLKCDGGHVIDVDAVTFGRRGGQTGCGSAVGRDCLISNSLETVKNICQWKTKCDVRATIQVFGDPCPGISAFQKYLHIWYFCVPEPVITTLAPEESTEAEMTTDNIIRTTTEISHTTDGTGDITSAVESLSVSTAVVDMSSSAPSLHVTTGVEPTRAILDSSYGTTADSGMIVEVTTGSVTTVDASSEPITTSPTMILPEYTASTEAIGPTVKESVAKSAATLAMTSESQTTPSSTLQAVNETASKEYSTIASEIKSSTPSVPQSTPKPKAIASLSSNATTPPIVAKETTIPNIGTRTQTQTTTPHVSNTSWRTGEMSTSRRISPTDFDYSPTNEAAFPNNTTPAADASSLSLGTLIGISLGAFILLIILFVFVVLVVLSKRRERKLNSASDATGKGRSKNGPYSAIVSVSDATEARYTVTGDAEHEFDINLLVGLQSPTGVGGAGSSDRSRSLESASDSGGGPSQQPNSLVVKTSTRL